MASSSHTTALFEPSQVSPSVSSDASLRFFETHGFFYESNATIGKLVDDLYEADDQRDPKTELSYFEPTLRKDSRLKIILDRYSINTRLRRPWGTTPKGHYRWDPENHSKQGSGMVAYMVGARSQFLCQDGSHMLQYDGKPGTYGVPLIPDELVANYQKILVDLEQGGVLLVHTLFVHRSESGHSIVLGLRKWQAGDP